LEASKTWYRVVERSIASAFAEQRGHPKPCDPFDFRDGALEFGLPRAGERACSASRISRLLRRFTAITNGKPDFSR
jgi:hypothetical protein